jgi:hypothetical protein
VTANAAEANRSRARKRKQLLALRGKVQWQADLNALRRSRVRLKKT